MSTAVVLSFLDIDETINNMFQVRYFPWDMKDMKRPHLTLFLVFSVSYRSTDESLAGSGSNQFAVCEARPAACAQSPTSWAAVHVLNMYTANEYVP